MSGSLDETPINLHLFQNTSEVGYECNQTAMPFLELSDSITTAGATVGGRSVGRLTKTEASSRLAPTTIKVNYGKGEGREGG